METIMIILLISLPLFLSFFIIIIPSYSTMLKFNNSSLFSKNKKTFKQFLKEFNKIKTWERDSRHRKSFFDFESLKNQLFKSSECINYVHASIIKINNIYYPLKLIDYFKFESWLSKNKYTGPGGEGYFKNKDSKWITQYQKNILKQKLNTWKHLKN